MKDCVRNKTTFDSQKKISFLVTDFKKGWRKLVGEKKDSLGKQGLVDSSLRFPNNESDSIRKRMGRTMKSFD